MLHDLTGSEYKIVHAYKVSGWAAGSHWFGKQIVHAYEDQDGAAGSHGFGTTDPTCLRGFKTALQALTGSEDQLVHT